MIQLHEHREQPDYEGLLWLEDLDNLQERGNHVFFVVRLRSTSTMAKNMNTEFILALFSKRRPAPCRVLSSVPDRTNDCLNVDFLLFFSASCKSEAYLENPGRRLDDQNQQVIELQRNQFLEPSFQTLFWQNDQMV